MQAEQVLEEADIIFSDSAAKKVADLIQEEKKRKFKTTRLHYRRWLFRFFLRLYL